MGHRMCVTVVCLCFSLFPPFPLLSPPYLSLSFPHTHTRAHTLCMSLCPRYLPSQCLSCVATQTPLFSGGLFSLANKTLSTGASLWSKSVKNLMPTSGDLPITRIVDAVMDNKVTDLTQVGADRPGDGHSERQADRQMQEGIHGLKQRCRC